MILLFFDFAMLRAVHRRSFIILQSKAELQQQIEVLKTINAKDKEIANVANVKDKEIANVANVKDKEIANVENVKDKEIATLTERLRNASTAVLVAKESYTVRAAVECLMDLHYKSVSGGMQNKIDSAFQKPNLMKEFETLCQQFNSKPDKRVVQNLYHSLSSHVHGGGFPIQCHTTNNILTPAEWAAVIALFKTYLAPDAFQVFDAQDVPIIVQK
jgi:hypothetical protein